MYNLKITIRRLLKDKAYSLICIVGLIIGISSFLILFLHVNNEKTFDKHFTDHKQIYRVISTPVGHDANIWARSLGIVHTALPEIPEVELATEFIHSPAGILKIDDNSFQQNDIFWVDKTFVEMFDVRAKVGSLLELEEPNTVFISEDFAHKHFGKQNPVGQIIKFESTQYTQDIGDYVIRGIIKNTQPKTHFKYELLASQKGNMQKSFDETLPNLKILWAYNYFKLQKGASPTLVAQKLKDFWDNSSLKQERGPKEYDFSLFPMDDIHLKSDFRFELLESSSKLNVGLFIIISLVVLLISLLNFINLTIAKLIKRTRELGLKRSIGAAKIQLTGQVLIEVFLVCSLSIIVSFALAESLKPVINQLFEINFDIYYSDPVVYLSMVAILITCLLLTALFVTFFLFGKATTIDILAERTNFSGSTILKSLLVGQVCIVIILVSGTFLVNKQINFISNRSLGFDKENVVVLHVKDLSKDPKVFAEALRKQSQVKSVGFTNQHFGYPSQSLPLESLGIEGTAEMVFANYDYLKTMNIRLTKNWVKPEVEFIKGMVINEHLYKRLMEKHGSIEALNAFLAVQPIAPDQVRINVIGVAKDFNYNSAHQAIGDFAFWVGESPRQARFTHIRLNPGNLHSAIAQIRSVWEDYYQGQELDYFFIDDKIAEQYKGEIILSRILSSFSILGILISIIGISALSLFISQQRTKEIGIRKVNGAKVSEVLAMLNKDFIKWVTLAFLIATPVAYYAMSKWLENFAYKTTLSWWIFALAGVLALGIALLTVSFQSWKAATRNPVEALRYE